MGQRLVSVRTAIQNETTKIHEYIRQAATTDPACIEYVRQERGEARTGATMKELAPVCTTSRKKEWLISRNPTIGWTKVD